MGVETQATIGKWAKETFPGGDDLSSRHCLRLLEEVVELCLAAGASPDDVQVAVAREIIKHAGGHFASNPKPEKVPEELADCEIVMRVLAERRDVDLQAEVDRKMAINRERKWNARPDGTGYHVPANTQPQRESE